MSRTKRKKNFRPNWVKKAIEKEGQDAERMLHKFHGDSFNHDGDKNPPKWFKQTEERKFRRKTKQRVEAGDEVIPSNFKMPYYT